MKELIKSEATTYSFRRPELIEEDAVESFIAGAEFMQKELEREWDLICQGWHFELEAKEDKLKIAVEALTFYDDLNAYAKQALKELDAKKGLREH
jgi:hypothetical protein